MARKQLPFLSSEEIGMIGSYSSFLGLLLIATILGYRHIFDTVFDLAKGGLPTSLTYLVFTIMMVIFALLFIVLPSIPIVKDTTAMFKKNNRRMAWMLVFLLCVYNVALVAQLIYTYLDHFGG